MKLKTFLPALLLLVTAAAYAGQADDHLMSGSKFVQDKKYKEALKEFETAVTVEPDNAEANRLLGLTHLNLGDPEKAAEYTLKSAQLKPNYAVYYMLGLIYSSQGYAKSSNDLYAKAVESYEAALKFNPKSYDAWHQLGKVHSQMLEFNKAIEAYQKAAELNPKFPDAFQGLGSSYYWAGDITSALQQVDALNKLGFADKAAELERWIKDKELKKKKAEKRAAPKIAAAAAAASAAPPPAEKQTS